MDKETSTPADQTNARQQLLEAKAQYYDCMVQAQEWQKKAQEANARIAELMKDTQGLDK